MGPYRIENCLKEFLLWSKRLREERYETSWEGIYMESWLNHGD